jgi:hypothetical protein
VLGPPGQLAAKEALRPRAPATDGFSFVIGQKGFEGEAARGNLPNRVAG